MGRAKSAKEIVYFSLVYGEIVQNGTVSLLFIVFVMEIWWAIIPRYFLLHTPNFAIIS